MLAKIRDFVNSHFNDIILSIIVALLALFSFAAGYLISNYQQKTPIQIEQNNK